MRCQCVGANGRSHHPVRITPPAQSSDRTAPKQLPSLYVTVPLTIVSMIFAWPHAAHSNVRTSKPEPLGVDRISVIRSVQFGQRGCSMAVM
jgi:hypothetical protein